MTEQEKIIAKFVAIREDQGISQAELGKKAKLHQPVIARMEKLHHSPQLNTFLKALEPLGYTLDIVPKREENSDV